FNAETWRKYGWSSTFNSDFRDRFARGNIASDRKLQGSTKLIDLEAYFANALGRGRRFHEALAAPGDLPAPVTIYAFGGDCEDTLSAPVIIPHGDKTAGWVTLTRPATIKRNAGSRITKDQVIRAMFAPGDGITTRSSVLGGGWPLIDDGKGAKAIEKTLPVTYTFFNCAVHNDLTNNGILQNNAFTLLMREVLNK
ncbi:MAG: hypothetical protein ACRD63_03525, partial [Pyrinomonadaceae bacterium]